MRTIFISVVLIGLFESFSGTEIRADISKEANSARYVTPLTITTEPHFSEIGGSLFLAVQTEQYLRLAEGAVIQFDFRKNGSIKSFHVNDANQNIIDQGKADILVMIHQELALALRSNKLAGIKVIDGDRVMNFVIDDYWQPHTHLTNLK